MSPAQPKTVESAAKTRAQGVAATLGAFVMWGFAPIYFKSVGRAGALEILSHRVVWSVVLLLAVVAATRSRAEVREALGGPRRWVLLFITSLLISGNWLLYIWAVNAGHIVDSSLGYFINPLVNVALGALFLSERFTRAQGVAIGLACAGVASFVWSFGKLPWLSLVLPVQFGLYGLLRKKASIDPLVGLLAETALLLPLALGYLGWLAARGEAATLANGVGFFLLLAFAGVMTALPLLLFGHGAQRLRLSTVGLIQYVSPTCQLAAGVLLYGELFTKAHAVAFAFIWAGLLLYSVDAIRRANSVARAERPEPQA
ncbi:MAG: EamA family transporter RarD [Myxococcales bacterium]